MRGFSPSLAPSVRRRALEPPAGPGRAALCVATLQGIEPRCRSLRAYRTRQRGLPDPLPAVGRGGEVQEPQSEAVELSSRGESRPPTSWVSECASRRNGVTCSPHGVPHDRFSSRRSSPTGSPHGVRPAPVPLLTRSPPHVFTRLTAINPDGFHNTGSPVRLGLLFLHLGTWEDGVNT